MKIALITLGCSKNLVDAEVMMGLLHEAGHELTGDVDGADVAVVNTCSFISAATRESGGIIDECLELKRLGALRAVIVAGCLPQRFEGNTLEMYPDVDGVVGCSEFDRIADAVSAVARGERPFYVSEPTSIYDETYPRVLGTPAHLAYVKIAEGCDNRCTYCTIPSIRGRLRSRSPDSIVAEAGELRALGVQELMVIAQDTTAYGTDIAPDIRLPALLRRISRSGIPWIRLLYTHPAHVDDDLLSVLGEDNDVLPYLDVPIQHVSDRMLKSMGRGIDGDNTRRLLDRARRTVPGITIRTTVIVGFPGETSGDFEELVDLVRGGAIDHLGIFEYSPEPGTPAAAMPNQVSEREVTERARTLHELAAGLEERTGKARLSEECDVLCDAPGIGRARSQAWELDGVVRWVTGGDGDPSPGTFFRAKVTGAEAYDLAVSVLGKASGETA
jgi:ribosomal protein S12 methylthiotransferase